jgi:lipid-binding SYLF domain-containing protein
MPRYKLPSIAHWTFALTLFTALTGSAFGQGAMTDTGRAPGNPPATVEKTTPQSLVNAADTTFINFMKDPQMAWLHENMPKAKAVLIAPEVAKAGFIFGGSGGRAVLVVRNPKTGSWSGPAFYTVATASVGFQAGVSVSETITLVMTDKGLQSLMSDSFKMGPDASVAAGPVGAGAKADIISDLVTYSRSKGIYGGVNLDGTVVATSDEWNKAYYKKPVSASDILVAQKAHNTGANKLLADVGRAGRRH